MTEVQGILTAALAVAMNAKCNDLAQSDVDDLRNRAEQELGQGHVIFRSINEFAVQLELANSPEDIFMLGDRLHDRVSILAVPTPPGTDRRDIHG